MPPGPMPQGIMPPPQTPPGMGGPGGPPFGMAQSGNVVQDLMDQASSLMQTAFQVATQQGMSPFSDQAVQFQNLIRTAQGITAGMKGSLHPIGPGLPPGGMGRGPEGNHPLLRNLPDIPPPPSPMEGGMGGPPGMMMGQGGPPGMPPGMDMMGMGGEMG